MKILFTCFFTVLILTACVTKYAELNIANMVSEPHEFSSKKSSIFKNNMAIEAVIGGQIIQSPYRSYVTKESFKQAFTQSLQASNLLSSKEATFLTTADIVNISQPELSGEIRVDATVLYTIKNVKNDRIIYQKAHGSTSITQKGEAFTASERLQMANEDVVRKNIHSFLKDLQNN